MLTIRDNKQIIIKLNAVLLVDKKSESGKSSPLRLQVGEPDPDEVS